MRYQYNNRRPCEHIAVHFGDDGVSPIHDGDYGSELFTAPKFGCIHHEPHTAP